MALKSIMIPVSALVALGSVALPAQSAPTRIAQAGSENAVVQPAHYYYTTIATTGIIANLASTSITVPRVTGIGDTTIGSGGDAKWAALRRPRSSRFHGTGLGPHRLTSASGDSVATSNGVDNESRS
jgi:hypothetical protein